MGPSAPRSAGRGEERDGRRWAGAGSDSRRTDGWSLSDGTAWDPNLEPFLH